MLGGENPKEEAIMNKPELTPDIKAQADGDTLFISSANLTRYATALNMELGVLIKGGDLPGRVASHFERLIENGTLRRMQQQEQCG